jgi:outer membrane lipoprotein SlyB
MAGKTTALLSAAALLSATLSACATAPEYRPNVDMAGKTTAQYEYDLYHCRENARQVDIAWGVALGVIFGAAFGALGGALAGDAGAGAAIGAMGGAVAGGAGTSAYNDIKAANAAEDPMANRIRTCMQERGYTILDGQAKPKAAS